MSGPGLRRFPSLVQARRLQAQRAPCSAESLTSPCGPPCGFRGVQRELWLPPEPGLNYYMHTLRPTPTPTHIPQGYARGQRPPPPRCATESVTSPCAAPWAGVRGELCLPSRTGLAGCLRGGGSARTSLARAHAPLSPLLPPSIADRLSRMSTKVVDTTTHPLPSKQTSPLARTVPESVHVFPGPQFRINCAAATTPAHIPRTALNA